MLNQLSSAISCACGCMRGIYKPEEKGATNQRRWPGRDVSRWGTNDQLLSVRSGLRYGVVAMPRLECARSKKRILTRSRARSTAPEGLIRSYIDIITKRLFVAVTKKGS
ncbi:hypothetical protein Trydic_g19733 [Trypoxylus dichotomus]